MWDCTPLSTRMLLLVLKTTPTHLYLSPIQVFGWHNTPEEAAYGQVEKKVLLCVPAMTGCMTMDGVDHLPIHPTLTVQVQLPLVVGFTDTFF